MLPGLKWEVQDLQCSACLIPSLWRHGAADHVVVLGWQMPRPRELGVVVVIRAFEWQRCHRARHAQAPNTRSCAWVVVTMPSLRSAQALGRVLVSCVSTLLCASCWQPRSSARSSFCCVVLCCTNGFYFVYYYYKNDPCFYRTRVQ